MFSILKRKEAEILYENYPTQCAGSTLNPEKIIGTPNQPLRTNISPRMFETLKKKMSQKFV
jgi:hypothetical protein